MLIAKLFIKGTITVETGLHIGGSKGALVVGEIDNNVIKTADGIPYIPGSSLKGKLRSLAENGTKLESGQRDKKSGICTDHKHPVGIVFGVGASYKRGENEERNTPTRLIVRDAFISDETTVAMEKKAEPYSKLGMDYTESKHENVIDRFTGGTVNGGLREMERVPKGATFRFEMVYSILEKSDVGHLSVLTTAMKKLEDDYLGGSGTRGYGQVKFSDIKISIKTAEMYEADNSEPKELTYDDLQSPLPTDKINELIETQKA